jgi:CHASE2 domain-containing sensor protein
MASLALPEYGWLYMLGIFFVLFLQTLGIILYYFIHKKALTILLVRGLGLLLILFLCFGIILVQTLPPHIGF